MYRFIYLFRPYNYSNLCNSYRFRIESFLKRNQKTVRRKPLLEIFKCLTFIWLCAECLTSFRNIWHYHKDGSLNYQWLGMRIICTTAIRVYGLTWPGSTRVSIFDVAGICLGSKAGLWLRSGENEGINVSCNQATPIPSPSPPLPNQMKTNKKNEIIKFMNESSKLVIIHSSANRFIAKDKLWNNQYRRMFSL